ncbi:MAG: hypothetical protein KY432_11980, partial [Acidobacteria bacterium]|nr:hypothetical protein [Acidobacteriota bacterium]
MQYSWKSRISPRQNYSDAPTQLPPLLAEPVAVYHGRVPAMFLPNGSIDIILSAGSPLPAPWGLTDMLIQVRKHRAFRVPVESADAIRIPLEIGAYGL